MGIRELAGQVVDLTHENTALKERIDAQQKFVIQWERSYDRVLKENATLKAELAEVKVENDNFAFRIEQKSRELAAIKSQEPVGYVDAEQFRRWDVLRGTEFESAERCYLPFSTTPFKTDMTDCSLAIYTPPQPTSTKPKGE